MRGFRSDDPSRAHRIVSGIPALWRALTANVGTGLRAVFRGSTYRDAWNRLRADLGPTAADGTPRPRPWRRWPYQVAAGVTVLAVGTAVVLVLHGPDGGTTSAKGSGPAGAEQPADGLSGVDAEATTAPGATAAGGSGTTNGKKSPSKKAGKPGTPAPNSVTVKVNGVNATITNSGSLPKERQTLRIVSAPTDLTGQRELAWVADNGEAVGEDRCTQNIRLNPGDQPKIRPTMLICWRTSATKSVYTVAVDLGQHPVAAASVAKLDATWATMR